MKTNVTVISRSGEKIYWGTWFAELPHEISVSFGSPVTSRMTIPKTSVRFVEEDIVQGPSGGPITEAVRVTLRD